MAIRFYCTLCGKPIEIDDEWADKSVACPYCRGTVTAPSTSKIAEGAIDGSFQNTDGDIADTPFFESQPSSVVSSAGNAAAIFSLILAVMAIALFIAASVVVAQYPVEFEAFGKDMETLATDSPSMIEAATKYMDSQGGKLPHWLLLFSMLQMGMLACAVIGSICGIIALRKRARRGMAIFSLVVCGITIVLMCSGMVG